MSSELFSSGLSAQLVYTKSGNNPSSIPSLVDQSLLPETSLSERTVKAAHTVYEHLIALWTPAIIEAAYELDVFVELAKGPADVTTLANTLQSDLRGMRILL